MLVQKIEVHYSVEFANPNTGLRRWKKYVGHAYLEPGEDAVEQLGKLEEKVEEANRKRAEKAKANGSQHEVLQTQVEHKVSAEAKNIAGILACKDIDELDGFKYLAEKQKEKFPEIWSAYQMMEKKLSK